MIPPAPHDPNDPATLVLRRTLRAPRERVFRAWIDPAALERWLKPQGMHMTVAQLDARVGGAFRFELENGESIAGMYLEIRPPERLVFTWSGRVAQGGETVVRLDFLERDPLTTEVLLTHEGLRAPERRARARAGWASMLDALAEVLASPQRES